MNSNQVRVIPIRSDLDVVAARVEGRNMAREMGFGTIDQARIATAISELARNIVLYAKSGQATIRVIVTNDGHKGLEVVCEDQGPGIPDLALAQQDGYSTSGGLGMGLPGTRRLMDEFYIETELNVGTKVTIRKWLR